MSKRTAPYRMCNRERWVGIQPTDPESDPIPVKTLAEDPAAGLIGAVPIVAPLTWTPLPLYDHTGTVFTPTPVNSAGLKDVFIKNEETVTGQFLLRMTGVATPPWLISCHITAGATVSISFNGCPPIWAVLECWSSVGLAEVTVAAVMN